MEHDKHQVIQNAIYESPAMAQIFALRRILIGDDDIEKKKKFNSLIEEYEINFELYHQSMTKLQKTTLHHILHDLKYPG